MSDPVTNVEIEDVLSSIRRLVSSEADRQPAEPDTAPDAPMSISDSRFVLTPSLRVSSDPAPAPEVVTEDLEESEQETASYPSEIVDELVPADRPTSPTPLLLTPDAQTDTPLIHDGMSMAEQATLETKIAELEAAVGAHPEHDWEPDGSEAEQTSNLAEIFVADAAEHAAQQDYVEVNVAEVDAAYDDRGDSARAGDDLIQEETYAEEAAFEALAAAQQADEPIFDAPQSADMAVDEAGADDHTAAQFAAEPEDTADTTDLQPTFRHTPIDDPFTDHGDDLQGDDEGLPIPDDLDETIAAYIAGGAAMKDAEMRQMVVDVVRDELRGELGERITRNVRKMVRREVLRALQTNRVD